jgi:hypothetical protein
MKMEYPSKRKQFHLSSIEENILREMSAFYEVSEAEVVRMAIREFAKERRGTSNTLVDMAKEAKREAVSSSIPGNLSQNHDHYLAEINNDER